MGYHNFRAAEKNVLQYGKLCRGKKMTADMTATAVLYYMCMHTYDYPVPSDAARRNMPARLYESGIARIAKDIGMERQPISKILDNNDQQASKKRLKAVQQRLYNAVRFLRDRGIIKIVRKGFFGKNGAYLLMIGASDEENNTVEHYDRRMLKLREEDAEWEEF